MKCKISVDRPRFFQTIARQWRALVEAIRDADSVVIVGYSFPQEDQYGRFLLKEGIRLRSSELTVEFFRVRGTEDLNGKKRSEMSSVPVLRISFTRGAVEGILGEM